MSDYIKLYRAMLEWEWYRSINTKVLFIHMLLKANWKEGKFEGKVIPRGSFVSSIKKLSEETELTNDEVRTALNKLLKTKEITKQSTNKFTVFTVVNYELYQGSSQAEPKQNPNNSQTIPKLFPTIEEKKEGEKGKNNINTMCKAEASALFERLWKQYPCKKGKGQVSDAAKKRLLDIGEENMLLAIERYKGELKKDADWRKPQNGSTFFNSGYVDYLDGNYEPEKGSNRPRNKFNQFEQKDYDFEKLEEDLLSN